MSQTPATRAQQAAHLLRRLLKGLDDRRSLPGGAAREKLDAHLVEVASKLSRVQVELPGVEDDEGPAEPPPRPVGIALALALFSHPHLHIVLGEQVVGDTAGLTVPELPAADWPIVLGDDDAAQALGLEEHELQDLREEVDRRVSGLMKQSRAVEWLWSHFGLPESSPDHLFRLLFPAAPQRIGHVALARRGGQLYAVVEQDAPPPLRSLFLAWAEVDDETTFRPRGSFSGRYVDKGLRRALARGIGAEDDDELVEILDRMVTVIPREGADRFLVHDHWRARGHAALADFAAPYPRGAWLVRPLLPDDLPWRDLLVVQGEALTLERPQQVFDDQALRRLTPMMRQLYAEILAGLREEPGEPGSPAELRVSDLELLDLGLHLRAVLQPLLDWAGDPGVARHVAEQTGLSEDAVAAALTELSSVWEEHLSVAWCGPPRQGQRRSVQAILTSHVLQTLLSLRALWLRPADRRWDHRDLLLLFTAHYFGENAAHRVWAGGLDDTGAPKTRPLDAFWGAWMRLLATQDDEAETFSGPFSIDL